MSQRPANRLQVVFASWAVQIQLDYFIGSRSIALQAYRPIVVVREVVEIRVVNYRLALSASFVGWPRAVCRLAATCKIED